MAEEVTGHTCGLLEKAVSAMETRTGSESGIKKDSTDFTYMVPFGNKLMNITTMSAGEASFTKPRVRGGGGAYADAPERVIESSVNVHVPHRSGLQAAT